MTETKNCHVAQQWDRNQNTVFFFDQESSIPTDYFADSLSVSLPNPFKQFANRFNNNNMLFIRSNG